LVIGDLLGYVARLSLGSVERDHPDRVGIPHLKEIGNDGFTVGPFERGVSIILNETRVRSAGSATSDEMIRPLTVTADQAQT
jgi:hypothetical protein